MKWDNDSYNKELKHLARALRKGQTPAEIKFWQQVRRKNLGFTFTRQRPIGPYIIDFYCPDHNLCVEIDGYSHSLEEVYQRDKAKDKFLRAAGFKVLRFTDQQIMREMDNVIRALQIEMSAF